QCLKDTCSNILNDILDWITTGDQYILRLTGPAGCGKSAIAQTIAKTCQENFILGASFFFFHGSACHCTVERLVPSIVHQLVVRAPQRHSMERAKIGTIIEEDQSILHKPLQVQFDKLLRLIFTSESTDDGPKGHPHPSHSHC
ncbi:hypothetical protein BDZ94DRAFT_1380246, partial [Collybia nuda]